MQDQFIDEAIASGADNARPEAENADIENTAIENEDTDVESGDEQQNDADKSGDDAPFPKKAVNALSKKDRKINALHAQTRQQEQYIRHMEQRLAALEQGFQQPKNEAPREDQFERWEDYQEALVVHKAKQFLAEREKASLQQSQQHQQQAQYAQWADNRGGAIEGAVGDIAKQYPEALQTIQENFDVIAMFNPQVKHALLESDSKDAALALLALAQEGRLEQMANLPYQRAVVEIGRAADRGAAIVKSRTISRAPTPMSMSKGKGGVRTDESMSGAELRKKYGI